MGQYKHVDARVFLCALAVGGLVSDQCARTEYISRWSLARGGAFSSPRSSPSSSVDKTQAFGPCQNQCKHFDARVFLCALAVGGLVSDQCARTEYISRWSLARGGAFPSPRSSPSSSVDKTQEFGPCQTSVNTSTPESFCAH